MSVDRSRLPSIGFAPSFTFPAISRSTLPSGLRLWSVEHHGVPVVTFALLLPVGSAADPSDRPGLAAVTADMADEGSGSRSAIEMHEALDRIGARFETDISADATLIGITTLTRFTSAGLSLLADMAIRPALRREDFERVRTLRLNRLAQLRDLAPAVAERAFAEALYGNGPYGHLPLGTHASLRQLELEEVTSFHGAAWCPTGATLIVVGDSSPSELMEAAAAAFSGWALPGPSNRPVLETAPAADAGDGPVNPRIVLVHRPGAAQSELRVGHVAAARSTPDYHALLLLNMVLGGQFVSRVNLKLREEKGYTYGARTSFDFRRSRGPFVLQVSVQTDATADALLEIHHQLSSIRAEQPPTTREVELARAALTRGYPRNFETAEQIARSVSQLALFDLPEDYFSQFVSTVNDLSEDAVVRAAHTHLRPDRLTTVIVGDRDKVKDGVEALGFGPVEEVPAG